jgi:hypothetical protein
MKVQTITTGAGTYATIRTERIESTWRLPNGVNQIAADLENLADAEEGKAQAAQRRAVLLRDAAKHVRSNSADT